MNHSHFFKNKIAIITGGSSGIGKSIAEKLAKEGCNLGLIGQDNKKLKLAKTSLEKFNVRVEIYKCDISQSADVKKIAAKIKKDFGEINFLVNNAGQSLLTKKSEFSEEKFDRLVAVNLKGVYLCSMLMGYGLMSQGGAIVNISSVFARLGSLTFSGGYAAAKAGVINLTKTFALEMAEKNIRVNCVAPGATFPTEISKDWDENLKKVIINEIPLKRLGKPEDTANAVYFLLSDLSEYITGQTLDVNGGRWMS